MKNFITLLTVFIFLIPTSEACVDYHPDSTRVTVRVDSITCEIMVEIANLQMFGGSPNEFCSCGVNSSITNLGQIEYVVFVDSVTHEPVAGFDLFDLNALTGDSWEAYDTEASYDWSGFVSLVNDSGIVAGQDVLLWIKLTDIDESVLEEWEVFACEDDDGIKNYFEYTEASFGTDRWDPAINELADDHLSISKLVDADNEWVFEVISTEDMNIFDQIVDDFYNSIERVEKPATVNLYPNPATDELLINNIPIWTKGIEIVSVDGKIVGSYLPNAKISVSHLENGMYTVVIYGESDRIVRTIIKK